MIRMRNIVRNRTSLNKTYNLIHELRCGQFRHKSIVSMGKLTLPKPSNTLRLNTWRLTHAPLLRSFSHYSGDRALWEIGLSAQGCSSQYLIPFLAHLSNARMIMPLIGAHYLIGDYSRSNSVQVVRCPHITFM